MLTKLRTVKTPHQHQVNVLLSFILPSDFKRFEIFLCVFFSTRMVTINISKLTNICVSCFFLFAGFGTFGKQNKNSLNNAIESLELTEDLESKRVQEIMGISEFGRKAKIFDITVSFQIAKNS